MFDYLHIYPRRRDALHNFNDMKRNLLERGVDFISDKKQMTLTILPIGHDSARHKFMATDGDNYSINGHDYDSITVNEWAVRKDKDVV